MASEFPVYVDSRFAAEVTGDPRLREWTDICHSKGKFVLVRHQPSRNPSRHTYLVNKRPYVVCIYPPNLEPVARSGTLAGALKLADRIAAERRAWAQSDRIRAYWATQRTTFEEF